MPRTTIPPSKSYNMKANDGKAMKALEEKLKAAETETVNLVRQLEHVGFDCSQGDQSSQHTKPLSPFIAKTGDAEILQRNYETLVSRVCRNESTLQTLKLNLCNIQAQCHLRSEQAQYNKEKLQSINESHENEKKKLLKDLATARKESKENMVKRQEAEEACRRLSSALEQSVQAKTELALNYEDLRISKQKLNKQLGETREELARELSLRNSLEQSHNALMERLQQLETTAHQERKEIESFSKSCAILKDEGINLNKEKIYIQNLLEKSRMEIATKEKQIIKQIEEMQLFLTNLEHLKAENKTLKIQLDELTKHTHNMKFALESAENEKQSLMGRLQQSESIQREAVENENQKLNDIIKNCENQLEKQIERENLMKQENEKLKLVLEEKESRFHDQQEFYTSKIKDLENSAQVLNEQLEAHKNDRNTVIQDKQSLLDEVNFAVDGMSAEHSRMQQELEEAKIEMSTITNEKCHLQLEIDKLLDRINFLEQQQSSQITVESSLVELSDSKNQLAYENGRLQSQLMHLKQQIAAITDARSEVTHLKRTNAALQSKVTSLSSALSMVNVDQKKMDNKLKQLVATEKQKDLEIKEVKKSRDEVINENDMFQEQLKKQDYQQQEKIQHLLNKLQAAKQNNSKMAATIKSIMQSHSKLQLLLEKLQKELGKKDAEIATFENGKQKYEESLKLISDDMIVLQEQLVSMETGQLDRVAPLKSELEAERTEKTSLLSQLDKLHTMNETLQNTLNKKDIEVQSKQHQLKQIQQTRKREKEVAAKDIQTLKEKIVKMQLGTDAENEKEKKQASREINRLRQANQLSQLKITDLNSTCEQQKLKIQEMDETNNKQKLRIIGQKTQLQQCHNKRKQSQDTNKKIEEMSVELEELEQVRNQYIMKNSEQMQTIATFLTQISDLQAEIQTVVKGQSNVEDKLRKKEDQFKEERRLRLDIEKKYRFMEEELSKLRHEHDQSKNELQHLSLQLSRQTLSRLAEFSQGESVNSDHMMTIERQLQKEKDHSHLMDARMKRIMNSSSRFVEDLALDFDESVAAARY
ncbi:coiled-coil domain-containing protein 150-like [Antedon mediterranea]|uniref:coiled-coil domain-containing protein 150-like n=1 Tax=Antedon mediterranea TaxID=105859 RepID=UPI003AF877CC